MAYAAVADFVVALGESDLIRLTNPGNPAATAVDTARLEAEAQRQSDWMDSYFGRRNQLPLPSVPRPAVECCIWFTVYALDNKRTRPDVRQRFEDWMGWLEKIGSGQATLGIRVADPAPVPVGLPSSFAATDKIGNLDLGVWW